MYHKDYGMCCSEEAAIRCIKEYEQAMLEENNKAQKRLIYLLAILVVSLLVTIFCLI